MTDNAPEEREIYDFIVREIDSVPHLEALLLLWNSRPQPWLPEDLARRLYISTSTARTLLQDLVRRGLLNCALESPESYRYVMSDTTDQLMARLDKTYRRHLVQISTLIHAKAPSAVLDFARAFRFTKERE